MKLLLASIFAIALQAEAPQTFEVAAVRPTPPGTTGGWVKFLPGGRFVVENADLGFIIQQVYGVKDYQVSGGPKWLKGWTNRFDIQAKSEQPVPEAQLKIMAKSLLAERFQLKVHSETRQLPVFLLGPSQKGLKITPRPPDGERPPGTGGIEMVKRGEIRGRNVRMEALVSYLNTKLERPVLDKSGFQGAFDFHLEWEPDDGQASDGTLPSLLVALQEQLGLKAETTKGPVEVLVVDRAELPSGN